jgi:three-Cys-motif partner protein
MTNAGAALQGQSRDTEWKLRGIKAALRINLTICAEHQWCRRQPYNHFDLNAGCGWNHDVNPPDGVMGSPLAYWEAAEESDHPRAYGDFVELDPDRAAELGERPVIRGNRRAVVHNCDNAEFCERIPSIIRSRGVTLEFAHGTIIVDPNGPTGIPWEPLARVLKQCPRLDVIVNWCGTGAKRLPDGHEAKVAITDIPYLLGKRHWLVRRNVGPFQWSLLIGRNFKIRDYPGLGFFHWDSARGQAVVETLSTVAKRKPRQLKLL